MLYQQLTDHCFEERLGTHGVSHERVQALLKQLPASNTKAALPLLQLPSRQEDLAGIETLATEIRSVYKTVVVAGTGGSGLSGRALVRLAKKTTAPAFHFLENIDPDLMDEVLTSIDVKTTCFLIISKSGATAETLAQFFVLFEQAKNALGKAAAEHFIILTMPGDNPLRALAKKHGIHVLDHEADIGGRFSILTNVGLLPAAIAGLDIRALRRGAKTVVDALAPGCAPAQGAALHMAFMEKHHHISVMLPYAERLADFSAWWRQGWAESLGKNGKGSTPIRAMGTTDQHSQLQLYLDGPRDKLFHMITLARAGSGQRIPADAGAPEYLSGKTLGDVMAAEQKATLATLVHHHLPVRVFRLERLGEEEMGALLMHFMLEIIFTAALLGVNPFDQPAVEEGKKLACDYLLKGDL